MQSQLTTRAQPASSPPLTDVTVRKALGIPAGVDFASSASRLPRAPVAVAVGWAAQAPLTAAAVTPYATAFAVGLQAGVGAFLRRKWRWPLPTWADGGGGALEAVQRGLFAGLRNA